MSEWGWKALEYGVQLFFALLAITWFACEKVQFEGIAEAQKEVAEVKAELKRIAAQCEGIKAD